MLLLGVLVAWLPLAACFGSIVRAEQLPFTAGGSAFDIKSLARSIELGGATSKATTVYTLTGTSGRFVFSVDGEKLSWLDAAIGKTSNSRKPLAVSSLGYSAERNANLYAVDIPAAAAATTGEHTVTLNEIYLHAAVPKPAALAQDAVNQGMYWHADLLGGATAALSHALPADAVKVRVRAPSPRSGVEVSPVGWSASRPTGSSIHTFTNTEAIGPAQVHPAAVLYEQPEPVMSIRKLDRIAQVSHWGHNVAIQDDIELLNAGPKLKGHFSRLTHQAISYMRRSGGAVSAHTLTSLSMTLPPNVYSPYFIDEVGNVSTSRFRSSPKTSFTSSIKGPRPGDHSLLELTPRYPLLGGWNYTFSIGYQQPLQDVLRHDSRKGRYVLAVPFLTPLKGIAVDEITFRIVLPEGAHNVQVSPPFPMQAIEHMTTYSYLDTIGRPTVVLTKQLCSERHGVDVLVSYDLSTARLLRKPLAISCILAACFVAAGILRRLSWSIGKR